MLRACETMVCVDIDIINDQTAEKIESFTVTLGRTPSLDSRITLVDVEGLVIINDDDGNKVNESQYYFYLHNNVYMLLQPTEAVVGLQRSIYWVREDVGVVQVCILVHSPSIGCPVAYPFTVVFSTDDSAGKHVDFSVACF